jgi:hypothetical protein
MVYYSTMSPASQLTLSYADFGAINPSTTPQLVLRDLQLFTLDIKVAHGLSNFLHTVTLPSLRGLHVFGCFWTSADFEKLFSRSRCPLEIFTLSNLDAHICETQDMLALIPTLLHLSLPDDALISRPILAVIASGDVVPNIRSLACTEFSPAALSDFLSAEWAEPGSMSSHIRGQGVGKIHQRLGMFLREFPIDQSSVSVQWNTVVQALDEEHDGSNVAEVEQLLHEPVPQRWDA